MVKRLHFTDSSDFSPGSIYCGNDSNIIINACNSGGYLYKYLDCNDYKYINSSALATSQSWYHDLELPWLFWDNISLGKCLENHIYLILRSVFENILAVRKVFEQAQPIEVTCTIKDPVLSSIIAATLSSYGISAIHLVKERRTANRLQQWKELIGLFFIPKALGAINSPLGETGKDTRLFFSFAANHFRAVSPLLGSEKYHNVGIQSVIGNTFRKYSKDKYNNHLIDSQTDYRIWSIYRMLQITTCRHFDDNSTKNILRDKFIFNGVSCFDVAEVLFKKIFTFDLPNAVRFYELSKKIYSKSKPVIVVFGDDASLRPRAAIAACKKMGIPTMLVQHGIIAAKEFYYPSSDYMAVWGDHSFEILSENGVNANKLCITGSCAFSIPEANKGQEIFRKKILIITNPQPMGLNINLIMGVVTIATEISNVILNKEIEIVVKVHPMEDPQTYQSCFEKTGIKATVQSQCDLEQLIRESLVVITSYSTVAIQAVLYNTPVICLPSFFPEDTRLSHEEIFHHAKCEKEAACIIEQILSGNLESRISASSREKFLSRYCSKTGIEAVRSCEAFIEEILSQPHMNNGGE